MLCLWLTLHCMSTLDMEICIWLTGKTCKDIKFPFSYLKSCFRFCTHMPNLELLSQTCKCHISFIWTLELATQRYIFQCSASFSSSASVRTAPCFHLYASNVTFLESEEINNQIFSLYFILNMKRHWWKYFFFLKTY